MAKKPVLITTNHNLNCAHGPQKGSRISPPTPKARIRGVVFIADVSKEAEKRFLAQPWSE